MAPSIRRAGVAAVFFANGALLGTWVSRIPAIQFKLHLTTGVLGTALLGTALGAVLGMPAAGRIASNFGSRRVAAAGLLIMCAVLPLLALTRNALELGIALAILGAGSGATDVAMNTQAVSVERMYARSIMSSFHGFWSIGSMVGAASGSACAAAHILPLAHFCIAAAFFGSVGLAAAAFGMIPSNKDAPKPNPSGDSRARLLALPAAPLAALGVITFCAMLCEGAMGDWGALYLRRTLMTSESAAAAGYAVFSLTMAAGRFAGDPLTHRFGPAALARSSGALAAFGVALAIAVSSPIAAYVGFGCVGAGLAVVIPLAFSAAGNLPGASAGPAIAAVSTVGYTGFVVGPPLIGFAAELLHLRWALTIVALSGAMIAALGANVDIKSHKRAAATA